MVPRPPAALDPLTEVWPAGKPIVRCHGLRYEERDLNDSTHLARFRPIVHDDAVVPTMYGASDLRGALSETVFHDVPVRGRDRRILAALLERWVWCEVAPRRDLTLVTLHGAGLRRLQISRRELVESDAVDYADTAVWASALHDVPAAPDGLCWRARQHDDSLALILFGTRVHASDLDVVRPARPVGRGAGADAAYAYAEASDITIVV